MVRDVSVSLLIPKIALYCFCSITLYLYERTMCSKLTAIQCPPLDSVVNGVISYAIDIAAKYDLGTVATYDCDPGFVLDLSLGGSEMRPCMDDNGLDAIGVWSGQEPICVRKLLALCIIALVDVFCLYTITLITAIT